MMRRERRGIKIVAGLFILLIGFIFGYYVESLFLNSDDKNSLKISDKAEKKLHNTPETQDEENESLEVLEVSQDSEDLIEITLNTKVIFERDYLKCGHKRSESYAGYQDMLGMTKADVERLYLDWSIKKFDENEVLLWRQIDNKCLEHYVVKEYDGMIGVFYQNSELEHNIKQVVPINVSRLRTEDRNNLKNGILIESDKELAQLLEDFGS